MPIEGWALAVENDENYGATMRVITVGWIFSIPMLLVLEFFPPTQAAYLLRTLKLFGPDTSVETRESMNCSSSRATGYYAQLDGTAIRHLLDEYMVAFYQSALCTNVFHLC